MQINKRLEKGVDDDIKNVSMSLSNVIDTKRVYGFWLKIDVK